MPRRFTGDWAIALVVVACSAILLIALAFALTGNPFDRPSRTLRVFFSDVTGVQASSLVKISGAMAGAVESVRILSPQERIASGDPANTVEVTLALNHRVPPLSEGLHASIASDTILSDKFILLSGGNPAAPALADGALIPGIPVTTFDGLVRNLDGALDSIRKLLGHADGDIHGILPQVGTLIDQAGTVLAAAGDLVKNGDVFIEEGRGLVKNGHNLVGEAGVLVGDGKSLINDNKDGIRKLVAQLSKAGDSLDDLATRAARLVRENESALDHTLSDARVAIENLKVASTYLKSLSATLAIRPQSVVWGPGRNKPVLPTEAAILEDTNPIPLGAQ